MRSSFVGTQALSNQHRQGPDGTGSVAGARCPGNTSRGTISRPVYMWCFLELRGTWPTGLTGASPAG